MRMPKIDQYEYMVWNQRRQRSLEDTLLANDEGAEHTESTGTKEVITACWIYQSSFDGKNFAMSPS